MEGNELLQSVCDTVSAYERLGNEVMHIEGATIVRNRNCPRRYDANHVADVRCATAADLNRLFDRVEVEFAHCRHRRFHVNPFTAPQFVARLALEGWSYGEFIQLLLDEELRVRPPAFDIRRVEGEADWAAYARLQDLGWLEEVSKLGQRFDPETTAQFVRVKRGKGPDVSHWLVWLDGVACAYGSSWPGRNGIGTIEDLFTHPVYRHRGMATAIIARAVADVRNRGARDVVIGADVDDTPKQIYAALGFRPVCVVRNYTRVLTD